MLIEIDGHERKFIIGKNREEFSLIESMGIANLSSERLKDMVESILFFKFVAIISVIILITLEQ